MKNLNGFRCVLIALGSALTSLAAQAQVDYSLYGVADLSYGRFEPSGFERENRFNSNSLSASFVGVNASYGFEGGWKPGITLETFLRFEDLDTGRNDTIRSSRATRSSRCAQPVRHAQRRPPPDAAVRHDDALQRHGQLDRRSRPRSGTSS